MNQSDYPEELQVHLPSSSPKQKLRLTRVGVSDFVDFIGIQPDLLFAAFHHRGCEPLLQFEGTGKETRGS